MRSDEIRAVLTRHADDAAGSTPDLAALHARVADTRRRRHVAAAVTAAAVLVAGIVLSASVLGSEDTSPQPAPEPPPPPVSGTEQLPFRAEPVEVEPPADARDTARPLQLLASVGNEPGVPRAGGVVDVVEVDPHRVVYQQTCSGSQDTWLVLSSNGNRDVVPCFGRWPKDALTSSPFPGAYPAGFFYPDRPQRVRMFVTTTNPKGAGRTELRAGIPATTTATFRLDVYGQTSPIVATLVGFEVSALGGTPGDEWWFTRGVEAPTGAESLEVELPPSSVDRVVQTVVHYLSYRPRQMPYVQIWLDGRRVDHRFDEPRIAFLDETTAYVPAGGPHTVELRVTQGQGRFGDFAVAIFEADG